jgi:hypothetical protein
MAPGKLIFGLSQAQIQKIEYDLVTWEAGGLKEPKYCRFVWVRLGNELKWDSLALYLAYFKYLESKNINNPINQIQNEKTN